jgi:hypothetical protein
MIWHLTCVLSFNIVGQGGVDGNCGGAIETHEARNSGNSHRVARKRPASEVEEVPE